MYVCIYIYIYIFRGIGWPAGRNGRRPIQRAGVLRFHVGPREPAREYTKRQTGKSTPEELWPQPRGTARPSAGSATAPQPPAANKRTC